MRGRITCLVATALAVFAVAATPQEGHDILISGARPLDGPGRQAGKDRPQ